MPDCTSGPVVVWTSPVTAPTPVVITASCGGMTLSATLTVLPTALASLTLTPSSLTGGGSATGEVTLTGPAPDGGAVVTLASDAAGVATLPESLVVAPGASRTTFPITTTRVVGLTAVAVTATCGGLSRTATLLVRPTTLASISLEPGSVTGSVAALGRVTLTAPAPGGGMMVTLTSATPGIASVPEIVFVPSGETSASFLVTSRPVKTTTRVDISASAGRETRATVLTVLATSLTSLVLNPSSVPGGARSMGTITLSRPAPPGGAVVALASANPEAATVPGGVFVSAGGTTATFSVTTTAVSGKRSVVLSAAYGGVTRSATLTLSPRKSR
jgi:hypothetical protein